MELAQEVKVNFQDLMNEWQLLQKDLSKESVSRLSYIRNVYSSEITFNIQGLGFHFFPQAQAGN